MANSDFTYTHLEEILRVAKSKFEVILFSEARTPVNKDKHRLILRHDLDASLEKALEIARIEKRLGLCSTYMVMTDSPFYSLDETRSRENLMELRSFGHDIGLHFKPTGKDRCDSEHITDIEEHLIEQAKTLERILGSKVSSFSFHTPVASLLHGPLIVGGMVNAYSKELMQSYLSDSRGVWARGDPILKLSNYDGPIFQLLIHPIWWGEKHVSAQEILLEFLDRKAKGKSLEYRTELHDTLAKNITGVLS